ncbi:MAG: 2-polyprenyl-3-methyl-5-hydroxy-6-metoxy-1,4-benzoquinol methylase [Glaciecola sp.]|jgi:2-polyprenyl-3-methyl-5-hydroxy-6-metoxy-1,4-benzoquinol methylase
MKDFKTHWEGVYNSKSDQEVSWYEEVPETSLRLIKGVNPSKSDAIIDVGGGNSNLTIEPSKEGFSNLSVLDISAKALERTKAKEGGKSADVNWIVSNVVDFTPKDQFSIWHDRAVFHFLNQEEDIQKYVELVTSSVADSGVLILGTFSPEGPSKCSGLDIKQYSAKELEMLFQKGFKMEQSFQEVHKTPFDTEQSFTYVVLRKR